MSARKWVVTAAVSLVVVLGVTAGIAAGKTGQRRPECTTPTTLQVTVAPAAAPVVSAVARIADLADLTAAGCVRTLVTARDPAAVAADIAGDRADRPDVWIPDSSIWLRRQAVAGAGLPDSGPSVARSPIVLAVSRRTARRLGWPEPLRLAALLPASSGGPQPVQLRLPDPRQSAATVGALLGLRAATAARADHRAILAAVLRASRLEPATRAPAGLRVSDAQAVPTTEQQVWSAGLMGRGPAVVAAYPPGAGTPFDYPYVVLATRREARTAAGRLLAALRGDLGRRLFDAAGFRDGAGAAGPALTASRGVDPTAPGTGAPPPTAAIEAARHALASVNLASRLLAVLDVSGSMALAARPGAPSRLDLARTAVLGGLALYPDDTTVGLWTFARELAGRTDYRQQVPIVPLGRAADGSTGRYRLAQALAGIGVSRRGGTGLYDTALAAVRTVRRGWDPTRVNSVVLLTDGRNADGAGIGLRQLLTTLRDENDPARPVYLITIAYGPDTDTAALTAMSRATGGEMYAAIDPLRIRAVLLDAIGRRICRPKC
jgi:hypothetical protein